MPAPINSILTTFTGSDEDPLSEGGTWQPNPMQPSSSRLRRVSNQCARHVTLGVSEGVWDTNYNEIQEAFMFIPIQPRSGLGDLRSIVLCRIQNENTASYIGYFGGWCNNLGRFEIGRHSSSGAVLAFSAGTFTNGDGVWLTVNGTSLELFHKAGASDWVSVVTVTDSSVVGAGKIGIYLEDDQARVDDFGGGEVTAAAEKQSLYVSRRRSWR